MGYENWPAALEATIRYANWRAQIPVIVTENGETLTVSQAHDVVGAPFHRLQFPPYAKRVVRERAYRTKLGVPLEPSATGARRSKLS
jgi:hypothetical protein